MRPLSTSVRSGSLRRSSKTKNDTMQPDQAQSFRGSHVEYEYASEHKNCLQMASGLSAPIIDSCKGKNNQIRAETLDAPPPLNEQLLFDSSYTMIKICPGIFDEIKSQNFSRTNVCRKRDSIVLSLESFRVTPVSSRRFRGKYLYGSCVESGSKSLFSGIAQTRAY